MYFRTMVFALAILTASIAEASKLQSKFISAQSILKQPENARLFRALGQEVLKPKPMSEKHLDRILRRRPKPEPYVAPKEPVATRKAMAFVKGVESAIPSPPPPIQSDLLYRPPSYYGRRIGGEVQDRYQLEFPSIYAMGAKRGSSYHQPDPLRMGGGKSEFMVAYRRSFLMAFREEWRRLRLDETTPRHGGSIGVADGAGEGWADGIEFAKALHADDFESFNRSHLRNRGVGPGVQWPSRGRTPLGGIGPIGGEPKSPVAPRK